jgi:hypothetical protein
VERAKRAVGANRASRGPRTRHWHPEKVPPSPIVPLGLPNSPSPPPSPLPGNSVLKDRLFAPIAADIDETTAMPSPDNSLIRRTKVSRLKLSMRKLNLFLNTLMGDKIAPGK